MNNEDKMDMALMRFSAIAPLVNGTTLAESINAYCRAAAKRKYTLPNGERKQYSPNSISRWYYTYTREGFDGLVSQKRKDEGQSRALDEDTKEAIRYLKKTYPKMPCTIIRQKLLDEATISPDGPSLSTITRFVNQYVSEEKMGPNRDMHRYERPHINEVWCGDSSYGPALKEDGKKRRTYCIAVIDDASRFIAGAQMFYNDTFVNFMTVLRSAISKYGLPQILNLDNGKSYKNRQMELLAARIGCTLHYDNPYTPTQKAKVERWFLTMKEQWMSGLNMKDFRSLEEMNVSLQAYVAKYNRTAHSSLGGKTPEERFFSESERIRRLSQEKLDTDFLLEIERRASVDNVIVIDQVEYEVPSRFSRQRIRLRYSPDMETIYVVESDETLTPIKLLNKSENSMVKREKVRYSGGEE